MIDDDPIVRGMLAEMLRREGYDVDEAEDGRAGMRQFRQQPAALVITDVVMPEQEGLETLMLLRQASPSVRVIAISGAAGWGRSRTSTRRARSAPTLSWRSRSVARNC